MEPVTKAELAARVRALEKAVAREKAAHARARQALADALEQQGATAGILRLISASSSGLQPVLDAVAERAAKLCEARDAAVFLREGNSLRYLAHYGDIPSTIALQDTREITRRTVQGNAVLDGRQIHVLDLQKEPRKYPVGAQYARAGGFRATLATPLMRDGAVVGTILIRRTEARAFSEAQMALLRTFADQAVIAIESTRLFNETKEALERQTATAEILKVIASSPSRVEPVLDAVAERAARLCGAVHANVMLREGDRLRIASNYSSEEGPAPDRSVSVALRRSAINGRAFLDKATVHVPDLAAVLDEYPDARENFERFSNRANLTVPMLLEGEAIGTVYLWRREPGPFSTQQVALLETFAAQAVIAIENARLFNETKEALERQTATSEILGVISQSHTDVQPVFETIVHSAVRLLRGYSGALSRVIGEEIVLAANTSTDEAGNAATKAVFPQPLESEFPHAQAIRAGMPFHVADARTDSRLREDARAYARVRGYRSWIVVPMLGKSGAIGAIGVTRREAGGFNDEEMALLQTFAAQAVIAIENARLFNETKEALQQQTATAEILKVISESPTDTRPVFQAIAERAARLCEAGDAIVFVVKGENLEHAAGFGDLPRAALSRRIEPGWVTGRAVLEQVPVQAADVLAMPEEFPTAQLTSKPQGVRTILALPLVRNKAVLGAITLRRLEVRPFNEKQIALLKTFADQAAIAIENVRLFNETRDALERQTATAEILRVISSMPTDTQPVLDAIVHSAQRLVSGKLAVVLLRRETDAYVAAYSIPGLGESLPAEVRTLPLDRDRNYPSRVMLERKVIHIPDWEADDVIPFERQVAKAYGIGSGVQVPLLRQGEGIGALAVARASKGAFSEKEIALLKSFADQAVIAIENVRLFNETKEALERQTATAEILRVISSATTDVQPVFDAILHSALQLFSGTSIAISVMQNNELRIVASDGDFGAMPMGYLVPLSAESTAGTAVNERRTVTIADTEAPGVSQHARDNARRVGFRAMCSVPMLREEEAIGCITVMQKEPGGLAKRQLELLRAFADQAVIAIENVRLFKELQARTEALAKSVGQLTALSEVGQAVSSSLELETVLKAIVSRAVPLTGLDAGAIYEYDDVAEVYRLQAAENIEPELVAAVRAAPIRKGDGATGRTAVTLEPMQVADIEADSYTGSRKDVLSRTGYRAVLAVPLLRDEHLLGALQVFRRTPGEFPAEVVELLKTFATQSALAIQNARLFREIAEKSRQLEVASRHKSDFLASMSHELRTPLNAILGFNEMLLGGIYGEVPEDMRGPLADIQTSGRHLLRLINNVLDLAKIEAGRMELALADYAPADLVESVRATLRPLAAEKGLEFVTAVAEDVPLAHGDAGRLTQCLMNLAGNALKFTRQGRVEIAVALREGRLLYRVTDTGMGIPADKIPTLFSEFRQTDATIASEYGGTGLGLSISKKFIEMHRGRIWVESEPGKGSAFIFEIPLRVPQ